MVWRLTVLLFLCGSITSEYYDHYLNEFVAEIDGDELVAELVAGSHDLLLNERVDILGPNVFHFISDSMPQRSKRSSEPLLDRLRRDSNVLHVEQLKLLERHKRPPLDTDEREIIYDKQSELERPQVDQSVILERYFGSSRKRSQRCTREENMKRGLMAFDDPLFCLQWYLGNDVELLKRENNDGTTKGQRGFDVRASEVWKWNITGRGVVVTVLDDGLDHEHEDLRANYDRNASLDLNSKKKNDQDPAPEGNKYRNAHGTRCAGEIAAAADNGICGVGIAYNAHIGGVRMLDGDVTDKLEAQALSYKRDYIDIYSASWGPRDDGKTMEGPGHYASLALREGAEKGRGGRGSIFAWATGNGGMKDDCNCDGYVGSIYTISIGCVNSDGMSTYFSEICPSTMAVIFTGGSHSPPGTNGYNHPDISIITTDINNGCDVDFEGTSSAAPLAAGVFALVLEANADITWRDMQHLLAMTAHVPNGLEEGWTMNGGGFHVNPKFGFGVMDAEMMVLGAMNWTTVPEQQVCNVNASNPPVDLPPSVSVSQKLYTDGCDGLVRYLEHVQVHIELMTRRRGDLNIKITSPAGTVSEILSLREADSYSGEVKWTFLTVHHWGESPVGEWMLSVEDTASSSSSNEVAIGKLVSWSLTLYGTTTENPNDVQRRLPGDYGRKDVDGPSSLTAHKASQSEIQEIMQSEVRENQDEIKLNEKFQRTRQKLAQLNSLAKKILSDDDYAVYRKYVLGDEGQKEVEEDTQSEYSDNWWKRRLQPVRERVGDNRRYETQVDDSTLERLAKEYKDNYNNKELDEREIDRVGDNRENVDQADDSVIKRLEKLLEAELAENQQVERREGVFGEKTYENPINSDKKANQHRSLSDLSARESEKIDEIISLIDEMLEQQSDQS